MKTIPCLGKSVEEILNNAFDADNADEWRELELKPVIGKPIRLNLKNEWQEHTWEDNIPFWHENMPDSTVAHELCNGSMSIFLVPTWVRKDIEPIEIHRATGQKISLDITH
tara:strand:- start:30 stop:362 length:333 start_codon:yes stop_codon:yes gene_type:complete